MPSSLHTFFTTNFRYVGTELPTMYADLILKQWCEDHRLSGTRAKKEPAFYRNLERALDSRRQAHNFVSLEPRWDASAGFLSLTRTGRIREVFLTELEQHPDFELGAFGSHAIYGNHSYFNHVE